MEAFVRAEQSEANKAYCNIKGKFYVRSDYTKLIQCSDYFKNSVKQRESFLKKVHSIAMCELNAHSDLPNAMTASLANCGIVSIPYDKAGININMYTLKQIWAAAAKLLENSQKAIFPAPCLTENVLKFSVLKCMETPEEVQIVTVHESGKFVCNCKYYTVHSICSHVVASAELNEQLQSFLNWHSKNGKTTNKHKQATMNLNLRCVGQKGSRPRRRKNANTNTSAGPKETTGAIVPCNSLDKHSTHLILKHLHGTRIRKCYGCREPIHTPYRLSAESETTFNKTI